MAGTGNDHVCGRDSRRVLPWPRRWSGPNPRRAPTTGRACAPGGRPRGGRRPGAPGRRAARRRGAGPRPRAAALSGALRSSAVASSRRSAKVTSTEGLDPASRATSVSPPPLPLPAGHVRQVGAGGPGPPVASRRVGAPRPRPGRLAATGWSRGVDSERTTNNAKPPPRPPGGGTGPRWAGVGTRPPPRARPGGAHRGSRRRTGAHQRRCARGGRGRRDLRRWGRRRHHRCIGVHPLHRRPRRPAGFRTRDPSRDEVPRQEGSQAPPASGQTPLLFGTRTHRAT